MRIVRCLLLLLAHCAEHSWSSGNARSYTAISRSRSRKRGDDDAGRYVNLGMYVHEKYSGTCGKADCGIRTAGSDEHNQPQQIMRRVGDSFVTMGSVHAVRCVPWYMSGLLQLCAHNSMT